ncbi:LysM peptidoglycan-binding domain-containing protein [Cellulomonas fimi]|uniref:Peptidoglycan-binding lysin domain protein n=1 Tax=Cellulomonas fimi (strain ATCC 484 / DSM 20113 / JCM 1341 / CCUG 24087 / LMG 16345 / NBRC 15513 / NCIMB 8980 / NCTC 7547 / NRS-133) TaxID=590998 RepID=F4H788_CELFA|nr:LysM peptidoglycan-binding domain-containing protein [Cellulomonas fimi]AEE45722.1 Peptidoglycan-binding lysin domain protein [Cellulomonas fimi ATCC 484]NNH08407.1 LysM peptidoglycan-binding domain-containing protein [Cellulomonas fimi]VEH30394.1 Uncharacterised protein [Cellulomonas fimi]
MSAAVLSPAGVRRAVPGRPAAPSRPAVSRGHLTLVRTGDVAEARRARPARDAAVPGPLRLTTRGRVVVVLLALLLCVAVSLVASRAAADSPVSGAMEVTRHVVLEGETLWALAEDVARPGEDVRDVVLELVRLNELPSAGLMAGQTIILPAR